MFLTRLEVPSWMTKKVVNYEVWQRRSGEEFLVCAGEDTKIRAWAQPLVAILVWWSLRRSQS